MNIEQKDFVTTETSSDIAVDLHITQNRDGSVTGVGHIYFYDAQNQLVETIEQPVTQVEINKFGNTLLDYRTWLLTENNVTLT
jgi:hypothetical protein